MDNSISEVQKASVSFQKLIEQAYQHLDQEKKELDKQKQLFQQMTKKLDNFHVGNKVVLDIGLQLLNSIVNRFKEELDTQQVWRIFKE